MKHISSGKLPVIELHTSYFLKRALFIIAVAVCVDIFIHQRNPFQELDVLYLIGFSMPLVILTLRLPIYVQYGMIFFVFAFAELARWHFGYVPMHTSENFGFNTLFKQLSHLDLKQWLVNGDFPLLPWAGVMLFGGLIGKLYVASKDVCFFQKTFFFKHIIFIFSLGILLTTILPKPSMYVVGGYAELFYPASTGLLLCLILAPMILLFLADHIQKRNLLAEIGRSSLAIYVLHLFLIHYVFGRLLETVLSLQTFFLLYMAHFAIIYCFSCLLVKLKTKYPKMPTTVTWIIGT
ncbi:MAG: DUF1624 domain-containing protein [Ottowia sp.]|nr:DUF1624 domain-containing protein [Ottowia sp.]